MTHFRSLLVNQFIFIVVSLCFSQTPGFQKLDNSNAFNKEYEQFPWPQWKVVVSFANPALTSDSFSVQQKSFNDIAPNKSFYKFLIENISGILTAKTNFGSFQWGSIPSRKEGKVYSFRDNPYFLVLPDSTKEIFRNTGCRFVLLFEKFHCQIQEYSSRVNHLMPYPNLVKEGIDYNPVVFSLSYVLYDLLEDQVVQFGKAFDDDDSRVETMDNIKKCLNNAMMDFLKVSKFYYKR
jgi:hypothetical protein